jgi:hypothetical protein
MTDRNSRRRREISYKTDIVIKEFIADKRYYQMVLDRYIDGRSDR